MKKVLFVLVIMCLYLQSEGQTIFVKEGGTGSGSDWSDAYGDLQAALDQAKAGQEIWVAQGIYAPSSSGDRSATFEIPSGVKVFGGFIGDESDRNQRNWELNHTILSGEIGDPGTTEDNSYTVVYFSKANHKTTLDGFTIENGYSDGTGNKGDMERAGGGIFNDGSNGVSIPVIQNCVFSGNFGRDGAAIYNYSSNGESSASIINCEFAYNKADLEGGAIYNDGTNGICNAFIQGCRFLNNEASYGAAIHNQAQNGETKPLIEGCSFAGNVAYIKGSGVFNYQSDRGQCAPIISGCDFEDNTQSVGGDVEEVPSFSVEKNNSKSDIKIGSGK